MDHANPLCTGGIDDMSECNPLGDWYKVVQRLYVTLISIPSPTDSRQRYLNDKNACY